MCALEYSLDNLSSYSLQYLRQIADLKVLRIHDQIRHFGETFSILLRTDISKIRFDFAWLHNL